MLGCWVVGPGLLGASGLAGRPGLWWGWRRRVPRPARPRCRLRGRSLGTGLRGDSRPDWRAGVEGQKRTRPDTARRLRERTEQVKVRGRQHVLAKPPESGHRGQGLRPGDGVQTRPLPTQPLQRPAGGETRVPAFPAPAALAVSAPRPRPRARRGAETPRFGYKPVVVDFKSEARTVRKFIGPLSESSDTP